MNVSGRRQWGLDPGGARPTGQSPGTASGAASYQLECEPFLGPPPGDIPLGPRDMPREMWGLPDAYFNKSLDYVANTVIRLLSSHQNSFMTSRVLPLKKQEDPKITWTIIEFDRSLAEFEPELGVPRLATLRKHQKAGYMSRHGMALEVNHGFAATKAGQDDWMLKLQSIAGMVQETMDQAGIMALVQAPEHYRKSLLRRVTSYPTLLGAYEESTRSFGGFQFRKRYWHEMHTRGIEMMSMENVEPDTWIVPVGVQSWASISDELETNADKAGEITARYNINNGYKAFHTFRGCTVHGARPVHLDLDGRTIEPLSRNRVIGKFVVLPYYRLQEITPGSALAPVHAAGRVQMFVTAEDDWHTFTWEDVYASSDIGNHPEILKRILGHELEGFQKINGQQRVHLNMANVDAKKPERPRGAMYSRAALVPMTSDQHRAYQSNQVPAYVSRAMHMAIEHNSHVDANDAKAAATTWAADYAKSHKCTDEVARSNKKALMDKALMAYMKTHEGLTQDEISNLQSSNDSAEVEMTALHLFNTYLRGDGKMTGAYRYVTRNSAAAISDEMASELTTFINSSFEVSIHASYTQLRSEGEHSGARIEDVYDSSKFLSAKVKYLQTLQEVMIKNKSDPWSDLIDITEKFKRENGAALRAASDGLIDGDLYDDNVKEYRTYEWLHRCYERAESLINLYHKKHHSGTVPHPINDDEQYIHSGTGMAARIRHARSLGLTHEDLMAASMLKESDTMSSLTHDGTTHLADVATILQGGGVSENVAKRMTMYYYVAAKLASWLQEEELSSGDSIVAKVKSEIAKCKGPLGLSGSEVRDTERITLNFAEHVKEAYDDLVGLDESAEAAKEHIEKELELRGNTHFVADMIAVKLTPDVVSGASGIGKKHKFGSLPHTLVYRVDTSPKELEQAQAWGLNGSPPYAPQRTQQAHEKAPFDFLLARPTEEYIMGSAILCKAGSNLGNSYYGHEDFMMSDDAQAKKHFGHLTLYHASIVKDDSQMMMFQDVFCQRYVNGGGSKILPWNRVSELRHNMVNTFRMEHASIVAIPIPVGSVDVEDNSLSIRNPIDLSGYVEDRFKEYLGDGCDDRVDIGDYPMHCKRTYERLANRYNWLDPRLKHMTLPPVVPDYVAMASNADRIGQDWSNRISDVFGFKHANTAAATAAAANNFHSSLKIQNTLIHAGGHRFYDDKSKMWHETSRNTGHFGPANDCTGTLALKNGNYGLATELKTSYSSQGIVR